MNAKSGIASLLVILCVVLGLTAGCSSSSNNATTPGTVGSSSASWQQVSTQLTSDVVTQTGCDNPLNFAVRSDGTYIAGPCHASQNDTATGHVTQDELNQLNGQVTTVTGENLTGNPTCEPIVNLASGFINLIVKSGSSVRLLSEDPSSGTICFHGNRNDVLAVSSTLGQLIEKYYPGLPRLPTAPGPSASPSP